MTEHDAFLSRIEQMKQRLQELLDEAKGHEGEYQQYLQQVAETFQDLLELETKYEENERRFQEMGDTPEELQKRKEAQVQLARRFLKLAGKLQALAKDAKQTLN